MKVNFIVVMLITMVSGSSFASNDASNNAIFGEFQNQILISSGQSIRSGFEVEDLFTASAAYSQPSDFFRIPGRITLEAGRFEGRDKVDNFSQYDLNFLGISQDFQIFSIGGLYSTLGLGGYIKSETTNRISSKFTFGQKFAIGYNFGSVSLETYIRHFSNGTLTEYNSGQNFYGLSLGYNF